VEMLQGFILFLIRSLPWLLPLTVLAIVTYLIFSWVNNKKENATGETATTTDIIVEKDNKDNI
jgi:hypothetical protein